MTTNKQIEEQLFVLLIDFAFDIASQTNDWKEMHRESNAPWEGLSPANMSKLSKYKKQFNELIKQTQKDTLDKVREIMKETWGGCACGYHGYLVLPDCDEEKHDKCFDCKLNQLEKKLV